MKRHARPIPIAVAASLFFVLAAGAPAEKTAVSFPAIAAGAEAMVTVTFVLKIKIEGGGDREIESEADCLMIGPEGLVLCSNTELGGYVSLLGRMMGGGRLSATGSSSEIEVMANGETEGVPARLVTRDTERDLAWLLIEPDDDAEARTFLFLDLEGEIAELAEGDAFYVVRKMNRFFDRVPVVVASQVGAMISKPRHLVVPSLPLQLGFGLPAFDQHGRFVGLTVMQTPTADEAQSLMQNPMSFLASAAKVGDMVGGLVLPAGELARATALARELIAADAAEAAEDG